MQPVCRRFAHDEKKRTLIGGLWSWRFGIATRAERELATQAAKEALDAAPATAGPVELGRIAAAALEPHARALEARLKRP